MATKKVAKTSSRAANDATPPADEHPLFPGRDGGAILKLLVKRVQHERRKSFPGFGGKPVLVRLSEELPSTAITTESGLAKYGPGHIQLWPLGAANRFAGDPYEVHVPTPGGKTVPLWVDEFEEGEEEAAQEAEDEAAASEMERVLRERLRHVQHERDALHGHYERLFTRMTEVHARAVQDLHTQNAEDRKSLGEVLGQIIAATAPKDAPAASAESTEMAWLRKQVELMGGKVETAKDERYEALLKAAKKGGDEGLVATLLPGLFKALPEAKSWLDERMKLEREKLDVDRRKLAFAEAKRKQLDPPREKPAPKGLVVDGVPLPTLEELRADLESGSVPADGLELLRIYVRDDKLPLSYAKLLQPYLSAADGDAAAASS